MEKHNAHSPGVGMVDIYSAEEVELSRTPDGRLWLNVDGKCLVRINQSGHLTIDLNGQTLQLKD